MGAAKHTPRNGVYVNRRLFNGNNFAGSAALAEAWALLCAIVVLADISKQFERLACGTFCAMQATSEVGVFAGSVSATTNTTERAASVQPASSVA